MDTKLNSNTIQPKIFTDIISELDKVYSDSLSFNINYSKSNDNNELTIKIRIKSATVPNPTSSDILFYIIVDYLFPETSPYVKCFSNFSFPTLWDGRNLLYSILNQNWLKETTILDIVNALPDFISRVLENFNDNVMVYYGDYQLDKVFDMNEFLMNNELFFFKIHQKIRKDKKMYSKERYIILTDIFFLLFDPVQENKSCGRLIFWGDIRQIINCKGSDISSDHLYLTWKDEEEKENINFEIGFIKSTVQEFMNRSSNKIIRLKENFKIFQEDMNKPTSDEDLQISNEKLITLIKYKEDILLKKYSVNIVRELMSMYQKIIEVLSAKNDPSFTIYLDKLHKMLQNQKSDTSTDKEKTGTDNDSDLNNIIDDGVYKLRHKRSFKVSENVFSTFNSIVEKPEI